MYNEDIKESIEELERLINYRFDDGDSKYIRKARVNLDDAIENLHKELEDRCKN